MDEIMNNESIQALINAVKSLNELDENLLTDEVLTTAKENLKASFSPVMVQSSVSQIIQNFEEQGLAKAEASTAIQALKEVLIDLIYGDNQFVGNKKILIDMVTEQIFDIFNQVEEKYHSYSITLPMTVDTEGGAQVPTFAHETDAAADLYAMETVVVEGNTLGNKIRTGVKIQLPEGWMAMILPRSSIGSKTPLRLSNSVGLIDSGYRGELGVLYDNISDTPYTINAGDRIAQLLVMPSHRFKAEVVDVLADSDRGETGFGDSGK